MRKCVCVFISQFYIVTNNEQWEKNKPKETSKQLEIERLRRLQNLQV